MCFVRRTTKSTNRDHMLRYKWSSSFHGLYSPSKALPCPLRRKRIIDDELGKIITWIQYIYNIRNSQSRTTTITMFHSISTPLYSCLTLHFLSPPPAQYGAFHDHLVVAQLMPWRNCRQSSLDEGKVLFSEREKRKREYVSETSTSDMRSTECSDVL